MRLYVASMAALVALGGVKALGATLAETRSSAIAWLERNQNPNGSWGSGRLRAVTTSDALLALAAAMASEVPPPSVPSVATQRAKAWLLNHQPRSIDSRARRIRALAATGVYLTRAATQIEEMAATDGWGVVEGAATTSYDTALVLGALHSIGIVVDEFDAKRNRVLLSAPVGGRRYDNGWSGDLVPDTTDSPSDRTTTAEIVRALAGVASGSELEPSRVFISSGSSAIPSTDPSLEVASRLVAIHQLGGTDEFLEAELIREGRLTDGVWSATDALVNARGLLAVSTKPGVTFSASDFDGDGVPNPADAFPYDPLERADSDGDGVGDDADFDDDGDGVLDGVDLMPLDPTDWADLDGDGIGDNADLDTDGDGLLDLAEYADGTHPARVDSDGDRFVDGSGEVVGVALFAEAWDLDGDGYADGEQGVSDPMDGTHHPGRRGDVAPLGHPDAHIGIEDATAISRILGDPSFVEDLPGSNQNSEIVVEALDANGDGVFDAGDALQVIQQVAP